MSLDRSARYSVAGWAKVAVYIAGFPRRWEPYTSLVVDDEGREHEVDTGEGEWVDTDESCGRAIVVMVGDDHKFEVDIDDLTPIGDEDYCAECGQIGCTADGRDRSSP